MRCKACNKDGALGYDPPDFYCGECIEIIYKTTGALFTLGDLCDILIPNDDSECISNLKKGQ